MRTEDVPQHIRDRVAQANGRGRAQVGNTAGGWRPLSEIRALAATMFGNGPKPRRAKQQATTRTTDPDADLYSRAWGRRAPKQQDDHLDHGADQLYRKAWPK